MARSWGALLQITLGLKHFPSMLIKHLETPLNPISRIFGHRWNIFDGDSWDSKYNRIHEVRTPAKIYRTYTGDTGRLTYTGHQPDTNTKTEPILVVKLYGHVKTSTCRPHRQNHNCFFYFAYMRPSRYCVHWAATVLNFFPDIFGDSTLET